MIPQEAKQATRRRCGAVLSSALTATCTGRAEICLEPYSA